LHSRFRNNTRKGQQGEQPMPCALKSCSKMNRGKEVRELVGCSCYPKKNKNTQKILSAGRASLAGCPGGAELAGTGVCCPPRGKSRGSKASFGVQTPPSAPAIGPRQFGDRNGSRRGKGGRAGAPSRPVRPFHPGLPPLYHPPRRGG